MILPLKKPSGTAVLGGNAIPLIGRNKLMKEPAQELRKQTHILDGNLLCENAATAKKDGIMHTTESADAVFGGKSCQDLYFTQKQNPVRFKHKK